MKKKPATAESSFDLCFVIRMTMITAGLAMPMTALAYIGPGAGITMIGALWAVLVAIVLTIFGIFLYPFRAMLRRRRADAAAEGAADTPEAAAPSEKRTGPETAEEAQERTE